MFYLKAVRSKTQHFHTKLSYQKPMLRQIEWWVQNGPITKNGVLPVTTLFFWKFCFSLIICYKEFIWCTNYPNDDIPTFCKSWSFIWRYFSPVSILQSKIFSRLILSKYAYFSIFFFNIFCPVEKCRVTPHCLYLDSLTLSTVGSSSWHIMHTGNSITDVSQGTLK